jgi:hypothetical protein
MSDKLQHPAKNKENERPTPVEEKQWQRDNNHRYADAVRQLVKRMLMFGFVVG